MMSERLPPFDEAAELGLVGSLLKDPMRVMPLVRAIGLPAEAFYIPAVRCVFEAVQALADADRRMVGIDILTVGSWLKDHGKLEVVGGACRLDYIMDATPTSAHAEYYLDIVRRKYVARRVIEQARETEQEAFRTDQEDALPAKAAEAFAAIQIQGEVEVSNAEVMAGIVVRFEDAKAGKKKAIGLATPWEKVTEMLCGLEPGIIILAGRPSEGKTTVEDQICVELAAQGIAVGRMTLDSTREELLERALCRKAGVSLPKLKFGFAGESQMQQIREARDVLGRYPMYIEDQTRELRQICSKARAWKAKYDIGLLTLDFVQLVEAGDMGRSQWDKNACVSYVSKTLKALALELNIPLLLLSQLSRGMEKDGRPPELSDLRDSGSLEQDAHKVLFVYRDRKWCKKAEEEEPGATKKKRAAYLDVMKHKNGETGRIPMWMRPHYFLFEEAPADFETLAEMGVL
jgi:replicative DNA helicase